MKILLDTHVVLWIFGKPERFSAKAREYIENPAGDEHFISDVTAWEASIKYGLGKLKLPEPPEIFFPSRSRRADQRRLRIDLDHVTNVHKLPQIHRDPFDRLLISQALVEGMIILSDDPMIRKYPVKTVGLADIS